MNTRVVTGKIFLAQNAADVQTHIHICERCLRLKQPQERAEMQPIQVYCLMELIHLNFLTLGGKTGDIKEYQYNGHN